jgi:hypothetical protein
MKRSFTLKEKAALFAGGLLLATFPVSACALEYEDYPVVKLRALDKVTARTMTFEAKVGSTVKFGEIFIKVQSCRKPPPVEKTEAASFLQVWQTDSIKDESKWVFSGWMFASSPTLSPMDHPIYDVWVLDCLGRDPEELPPPEAAAQGEVPPAQDEIEREAAKQETPAENSPDPVATEDAIEDTEAHQDQKEQEPVSSAAEKSISEEEATPVPVEEGVSTTPPQSETPSDPVPPRPEGKPPAPVLAPTQGESGPDPAFEGIY